MCTGFLILFFTTKIKEDGFGMAAVMFCGSVLIDLVLCGFCGTMSLRMMGG